MNWATVVATFCHILAGGVPICVEEVVVASETQQVSMMQCNIHGQLGVSKWMGEHPVYHSWKLQGVKCVPGHYDLPRRA